MMLEILKAALLAGLPVAFVSYYLIKLTHDIDQDQHNENTKKQKSVHLRQVIYNKYLKFGGGFYGAVALITYLHIECYQVIDFINKFTSLSDFIDRIGLGMLIKFFIEAIMHFITAIIWPTYWHKYLPIGSFWIWIIVAILAHSAATKYALNKYKNDL